VSLSSDDTPTGPIVGARHAGPGAPVPPSPPPSRSHPLPGQQASGNVGRGRNIIRVVLAAVLLVLALLFPWNLYFGLGIPKSSVLLWAILGLVTLLSLVSLVAPNARLRLILNAPYFLLVVAFIGYDVFESIRSGGTVHVPGGVGPGGWLGIAGALLAAQPLLTSPATDEDGYHGWLRGARIIGYASMFGASLTAGFNLCWRVRYALPDSNNSEAFGTRNTAVILTAVVYGVVALTAVLVASRWILRNTPATRFATLWLGFSTLIAGMLVWILPVGREIDAFHGIAQNTSTAGVGYEGYLAWAAAAALFVPLTLFSSPQVRGDREVWRGAIRKALTLIIIWCVGSVLMRLTDLAVALMLNYPSFPYDSITLAAFDAATAGLALWLRVSLTRGALRSRLITALSAFVITLTISRVILGVVLAPRFEPAPGATVNPVYGNNLAQQISSTFDVALCGLALCIFAAVIIAGRIRKPRRRVRRQRQPQGPVGQPYQASNQGRPQAPIPTRPGGGPPPPSEASTTQFRAAHRGQHEAPTSVLSLPSGSPRIFRSSETTGPVRPKHDRPPNSPS
jgi:hypothetical protein